MASFVEFDVEIISTLKGLSGCCFVTRVDTCPCQGLLSYFLEVQLVESVVVAVISGVCTLVGVLISNSRSRAVTEERLEALRIQVEKHNRVIERTYRLERDVAVVQHDIEKLYERTEG